MVGVALDIATDGRLDGEGCSPTLAVLGLAVAVAAGLGVRTVWLWWGTAVVGAFLAVPATSVGTHGLGRSLDRALRPPRVPRVHRRGSGGGRPRPPAGRSPSRGWQGRGRPPPPPGRRRGHGCRGPPGPGRPGPVRAGRPVAAGPLPGRAGLHGVGLSRDVRGVGPRAGRGAGGPAPQRTPGPSGQRTLLIFSLQLCVRILLRQLGLLGQLDTWRWGLVTWVVIGLGCVASCLPRPSWRRRAPEPAAAVASDARDGASTSGVLVER